MGTHSPEHTCAQMCRYVHAHSHTCFHRCRVGVQKDRTMTALIFWGLRIRHIRLRFREGNGSPLQYCCLENPMDREAWWAAVHGVAKSWTRLSDFTFTFHFHALEKEMATHSVLAWRIPGTGEPGGLLSVGLHRVGHDWSNLAAAAAANFDMSLLSSFNITHHHFETHENWHLPGWWFVLRLFIYCRY